jgi:zinc/manganese transport system substrate-binding protein
MRRMLLALALALAATPAHAAEPLQVVASFSILGDMVEQLGAGHVTVATLVGPDGDAHVFEPTPADAKALQGADLVVINGLGLEGWLPRLIQASGYRGPLVLASQGIHPRTMQEDGKTITDPHAWQDLRNGETYAANITAALAAADPTDAADFTAAGERYRAKLAGLDQKVRQEIEAVPQAARRVITSHDAFGYFAAAYGIDFIAPVGFSTEAEPSAGDLARIVRQMRATGVKALFLENMTDPRLIEQLAREADATIGGNLYADALSPPNGPAPTYIAMFENNVPKLVAAMSGQGS